MNRACCPSGGEDLLRHLCGGQRITGGIGLLGKARWDIDGRCASDAHRIDQHVIGYRGGHPTVVHIAGRGVVLGMSRVHRRGGIHPYVAGNPA